MALVELAVLEAGGYSGGGTDGQRTSDEKWSENGLRNRSSAKLDEIEHNWIWHGGSYFEGIIIDLDTVDDKVLGGIGGIGSTQNLSHRAGDGGTAGCGGIVKSSTNSKVYAYNGNMYTDGTDYEDGENECPIYCQAGVILAKYDYNLDSVVDGSWISNASYSQVTPQTTVDTVGYINKDERLNGKTMELKTSENNITVNLNSQGIGSRSSDMLRFQMGLIQRTLY